MNVIVGHFAVAKSQLSGAGMAAGEIGPGPDRVVSGEIALVAQLMGDGGTQRRIADPFGQRGEIAGEDTVQIFAGKRLVHPVDDGLEGRDG